ncbi:MAG: Cupin domain protein [Methanomassiliicoccales archaeon PtaU1.Bin124]|nr:MAG: Cupin domain protein [Methanomassiliicoccales archaeon PtaU1.Bin124]
MFYEKDEKGYADVLPGVKRKTLVHGTNTLFTEFRLKAGHELPMHSHPEEQTGYLVSGAIRLTIGNEVREVRPGDCWCVPGNVPHGAMVSEDSVAIEVFSPVRNDYLPK